MIKFENTEVVGWEHAIRGMRNPMNSWEKSDSKFCRDMDNGCSGSCPCLDIEYCSCCKIGPNDLDLMKRLRNAGTDHRKYLRYIDVYVDIIAPLYWWKEFKTYRKDRMFVDDEDFYDYDDYDNEMFIEMNSCSTMHKIHCKEFTLDDFSHDHLINDILEDHPYNSNIKETWDYKKVLEYNISCLNNAREWFLETGDKKYWWQMIQLLPSSYNQKRTVKLNYEVLNRMYKSRKNHKLDEWKEHDDKTYYGFCDWIKSLPYSELITGDFKD